MTTVDANDLGWAPDPPSPASTYHPQAVVTETITETWRTRCNTCGDICTAPTLTDVLAVAAAHCLNRSTP